MITMSCLKVPFSSEGVCFIPGAGLPGFMDQWRLNGVMKVSVDSGRS